MGLLKDGRNIRWRTVGGITWGWISTPLIAGIISFFCLFFVQNVFQQTVYKPHMAENNMQIISHTQILTPNVKNIIIRNYSGGFVAQAVVAMSKITGKAEAQNVIKYEKVIQFCNIDTENSLIICSNRKKALGMGHQSILSSTQSTLTKSATLK
jgi:phosphate/sulfate permease